MFWVTPEEALEPSSVSAGSLKRVGFLPEGARATVSSPEKWARVGAKVGSLPETASPAVGVFPEMEWESAVLGWASPLQEEAEWAAPDAS